MSPPFFSIITPTYNRADLIPESIISVLNQNFDDWELLIVDDGSTDETEKVVSDFVDERVKYFLIPHGERSLARNFGIHRAKGKYVCFLDSDDIFFPNHLQVLYKKIAEENFPTALFNTGMYINREGATSERPLFDPEIYKHPIYYVWEKFLLINSVCVHHEIFKKDTFPEAFNVWEDTHLWLRVVAQYPFFQILEITTQWNIHKEGSVSKTFEKISINHVRDYIECINDLFINYESVIKPFLNNQMKQDYIFQKLQMFLNLSLQAKQFITFFKLYRIGVQVIDAKILNRFVYRLLKREIGYFLRLRVV